MREGSGVVGDDAGARDEVEGGVEIVGFLEGSLVLPITVVEEEGR